MRALGISHHRVGGTLSSVVSERGGTIRTSGILVMLAFLLAACGTGGTVHVHYVPSPTPHKVVMLR